MLDAAEFKASPKLSELLSYLVTETLAHQGALLKGYTIGVDVFDRDSSFDPADDAIVRVQMGRLRKLVGQYYEGQGSNDSVHLRLNKGRYEPVFEMGSTKLDEVQQTSDKYDSNLIVQDHNTEKPPAARYPIFPVTRKIPAAILWAAAALVLIVVGLSWLAHDGRDSITYNKPAVYVVKYRTDSTDPVASRLSEGIAPHVVSYLSKFPDLDVFGYALFGVRTEGSQMAPQDADFVLSGLVEFDGEDAIVSSYLAKMPEGEVVWSDSFTALDLKPKSFVALQRQVALSVTTKIAPPNGALAEQLGAKFESRDGVNQPHHLCISRTYNYMRDKSELGHLISRDCLEGLVAKNSEYSTAWSLLSWIYGDEARYGYNVQLGGTEPYIRSLQAAEEAVRLDPMSALAYQYLSIAKFYIGDDDLGMREAAEIAISLNPHDADFLASTGWNYALIDGDERASKLIRDAIELNPKHPAWYWGGMAILALRERDRGPALRYARLHYADYGPMSGLLLAAALRLNERSHEADEVLSQLERDFPDSVVPKKKIIQSLRISPEIEALILGEGRG